MLHQKLQDSTYLQISIYMEFIQQITMCVFCQFFFMELLCSYLTLNLIQYAM